VSKIDVRLSLVVAILSTACLHAVAPYKTTAVPFPELAFVMGDWDATGSGVPGPSSGRMSFHADVQNAVVIRRNESRSASGVHKDLMVIYRERGALRADYYDAEGHVIRYEVTASSSPSTAVFLQRASPTGPGFRFTMRQEPDGTLAVEFEIAAPGTEQFKMFAKGIAHRA
jgi:hypothetical protein